MGPEKGKADDGGREPREPGSFGLLVVMLSFWLGAVAWHNWTRDRPDARRGRHGDHRLDVRL